LAAVEIVLEGEGRLYAVTTRHALDELALDRGARLFALIKTSALDERQAAVDRGRTEGSFPQPDRAE
jgi:molybdate transport system ATP-binding protein